MSAKDYLDIVDIAYSQRGGINHQRDALRTTSARRIRSRLVEDLQKGAIIPPVVIGLVLKGFDAKKNIKTGADYIKLLNDHKNDVAIIDGMQRTTALKDAAQNADISERRLRVELWLAAAADSLIYRMLVLNTGQIPWNLKQQLNVVYEPLINSIESKVSFSRVLKRKDGKVERRWNGGEFAAEDLVEAYIAFGLRRTEVDTQEHLADEFSRLDMADALTTGKYDHFFYPILQVMVDLDIAISRFNAEKRSTESTSKSEDVEDGASSNPSKRAYARGRNIFDTQPSRIGFVVAAATAILGRIGMEKSDQYSTQRLESIVECSNKLIQRINGFDESELADFLALGVLSEVTSRRPSSAVGRWERNFFEKSFKVLFEEDFTIPTMEACWRA